MSWKSGEKRKCSTYSRNTALELHYGTGWRRRLQPGARQAMPPPHQRGRSPGGNNGQIADDIYHRGGKMETGEARCSSPASSSGKPLSANGLSVQLMTNACVLSHLAGRLLAVNREDTRAMGTAIMITNRSMPLDPWSSSNTQLQALLRGEKWKLPRFLQPQEEKYRETNCASTGIPSLILEGIHA